MPRLDRSDLFLLAGMIAGAAIAAASLVRDPATLARAWPDDAVAIVAGEPVSRSAFETAVAMVERDRGGPLTGEEKARVLDRMIDEELLVQRGLALGLARSDRKLRGELVAAVLEAASAQADDGEADEAALRALYAADPAAFSPPAALLVAQVFVASPPRPAPEAQARAGEAAARIRRGEDVARVRADLGDPPPVELPASALPPSRLREWVGATAADAAASLPVGGVSDPVEGGGGWRVVVVLGRDESPPASFEAVREAVRVEGRRRRGEEAVRELLARLRTAADVEVAPGLEEAAR